MKFAIFVLIAAALLLLGCAASQPPSANGQQPPAGSNQQPAAQNTPPPIVGNDRDAHGCIPSAGYQWCDALQQCIRPWETNCTAPGQEPQPVQQTPPAAPYTCSLTLTPATISAGQSTDVGFSVSTKGNIRFTYDCGSEQREISTGGLTSGERLCDYPTAGVYSISIYADGVPCASQTLTVQPAASPAVGRNCSVELKTADVGNHYYELTAYYDGFAASDNVTWMCDDYHTFASGIETAGNLGISRQKTLTCQYSDVPQHNYIDVYVGGVMCGRVTIPV